MSSVGFSLNDYRLFLSHFFAAELVLRNNGLGEHMITWQSIDTVLLDMDGTLLDLKYDNQVWSQLLPQAYAKSRGIPLQQAGDDLMAHMRQILGSMNFYRFDYWRDFTGLDMVHAYYFYQSQ